MVPDRAVGRPEGSEYGSFYAGYVELVPAGADLLELLDGQRRRAIGLFRGLPEERRAFRYAPGKWSVQGVVGHLGDAERVFGSRAHRFSRGDETPLPGFDENRYAEAGRFDDREWDGLVDELDALRRANVALFRGLRADEWRRGGEADGAFVSVRALGFVLAGHLEHHLRVLGERYGVGPDSPTGTGR